MPWPLGHGLMGSNFNPALPWQHLQVTYDHRLPQKYKK